MRASWNHLFLPKLSFKIKFVQVWKMHQVEHCQLNKVHLTKYKKKIKTALKTLKDVEKRLRVNRERNGVQEKVNRSQLWFLFYNLVPPSIQRRFYFCCLNCFVGFLASKAPCYYIHHYCYYFNYGKSNLIQILEMLLNFRS